MSVARMLPEVSMASMMASSRDGSMMMACGRATATIMAVMPSSIRMAGACRRSAVTMPGLPESTDAAEFNESTAAGSTAFVAARLA